MAMTDGDVHITLTAEQASTLVDVIDSVLTESSGEIANTDNPSYRASLSHRRDLIRGIRADVEAATAAARG
jgi:hypothetical protein